MWHADSDNGRGGSMKEQTGFKGVFCVVCSAISLVVAVIGVIRFARGETEGIVICAAISLANSLIQCICGAQNNLVTEIVTIMVGAVVSAFWDIGFLNCVALLLCVCEIIMTVLGYALMVFAVLGVLGGSAALKLRTLPKKAVIIVVLLLLLASVCLNVHQKVQQTEQALAYESELDELKAQVDKLEEINQTQTQTINDLQQTIDSNNTEYYSQIVYITLTSSCYHRSECSFLDSKIECELRVAIDRGFHPCPSCKPPE